ncbi:hypothetical protein GCM10007978_07400 [Shewanella hanedai]|uniref:Uncharacterized protein n=1 Tax=Shewanella hanedai TaxID=25 RepID=A0A553JT34_SHEHA|nr:hypothetical protein [Shewanella hanedai]TRY15618.1 hypothetical protein FN961_03850 [Shewanella hanedai]GGI71995.1 hypothetical protein GCM10007978_07400 [Shewanella hanedai]
MAAFTKEQIEFIEWLDKDNSIEVCIEVCADLGKMAGYDTFNGHFQKRTLFRLKMQGFITEQAHYVMGIHWLRASLNQRGKAWLSNNRGETHA